MTTLATPNPPLASPQIRALAERLAIGDGAALTAFWEEVAARGTPLVERLPGGERHVLVTFLWRATAPVGSVLVAGGPAGHRLLSAHPLAPLPGSDVWYRTYRMRDDARFGYVLAADGVAVPASAEDIPGRIAAFGLDPLNRRPFPQNAPFLSAVELPGAPPQPWLVARHAVPHGAVHHHCFHSEILGNERDLWVYTPPGYPAEGEPAGLLLLFDGETYTGIIPTATILDNLIADGATPPLVAAMVANADPQARSRELQCHPPLVECLARELLPWLRQQYRVTDDQGRAIVGGASLGGLSAAYAAVCRPELFGNVLSQSGCFWWSPGWTEPVAAGDEPERFWLLRQLIDRERLPLRFHISVGQLEQGGVGHMQLPVNELPSCRHARDVLEAKGYPVRYLEYSGGHDALGWRSALPDALIALTGDYSLPPPADMAG